VGLSLYVGDRLLGTHSRMSRKVLISSCNLHVWYLDLNQQEDRRLLKEFVNIYRPKDMWSSPECRTFPMAVAS
jgi:hypothetical protein